MEKDLKQLYINDYFDDNGSCLKDKQSYFDDEGDLVNWHIIASLFSKYNSDSDIVKLHYCEEAAGGTHGNYCARTLFNRMS